MYIELVEKEISFRGKFVEYANLDLRPRDYQAYTSMFIYPASIHDYVTESGFSYDGPVAMSYLWFDFDCPDIEMVTDELLEFVEMLEKDYAVTREAMSIYFSGGKGYHLGIRRDIIGVDGQFDADLPAKCKNVALTLRDRGFATLDTKIYNHTRLFRIPNSRHAKSGLYKVQVTIDEIEDYGIDYVMEVAESPRELTRIQPCPVSIDLSKLMFVRKEVKINHEKTEDLFAIPTPGGRNTAFFNQAYRLFSIGKQRHLKINRDEIMQIMINQVHLTNLLYPDDPIKQEEFDTFMSSAMKRSNDANEGTVAKTRSFGSLAVSAANLLKGDSPMETGDPQTDLALGGGLKKGNFYPFIGMRQTGKSLRAEQLCAKFAKEGYNVLFFQGEMSDVQVIDRGAKRELGINFEKDFYDGLINEQGVHNIARQLEEAYNGNFTIVTEDEMNKDTIEDAMDKVEEDTDRKVDLICIDSFNRLQLINNSEYETNMGYGKFLKSLAKRRNAVVILIVHCNSQAKRYYRDNSEYIRGGPKIADESDGYFCFSGLVDPNRSQLEYKSGIRVIYREGMVWMMYQDKRSGGKRVDRVMEINENLLLIPVEGETEEWEVNFT